MKTVTPGGMTARGMAASRVDFAVARPMPVLPMRVLGLGCALLLTPQAAGQEVLSGAPTVQQAYLKAFSVDSRDDFGYVAVSGDMLVVGAPGEDGGDSGTHGNPHDDSASSAGAAFVFLRHGATWTPGAYLKASNVDRYQTFGSSVALSGDTLVVGAPGEESGATGVDGDQSSDDLDGAGAAYVFVKRGTTWTQEAYLKASNTGRRDYFGRAVAISGDTIVVGAPGERSAASGVDGDQSDDSLSEAGAAYVFVRRGATWTQEAYLKASAPGSDRFASSLGVSGDLVVVGAFLESSDASGVNGDPANDGRPASGAAYVFAREGGTWSQEAYLKASHPGTNDIFGRSVDVSGETVLVGAPGEDGGSTGLGGAPDDSTLDAGAAYLFTRSGSTWAQVAYVKASNTDPRDRFGSSVALSTDRFVVAAEGENGGAVGVNGDESDETKPNAGAAYVFVRDAATWRQRDYLKASNTGGFDKFGFSTAISGDTVVCGTPEEDGRFANGHPDDNLEPSSGAAYVFGPEICSSFCSSTPNASGAPAELSCTGDPGASLVLTSAPVPETAGQFFFGPASQAGTPFGDGSLCIAGPLTKIPVIVQAGAMMQPANTASLSIDYSAPYAAGLAGTQYFQHRFRSSLSTGAGFDTSNGLSVTF